MAKKEVKYRAEEWMCVITKIGAAVATNLRQRAVVLQEDA